MAVYSDIKYLIPFITICFFITVNVESQNISVHDPSVAERDGTYYLYSTGQGISVFRSDDLLNWHKEPPVFSKKPKWTEKIVPHFDNHIWAPDIFERNGIYYLYYAISSFGKNTSAIGVATNTTLDPSDPEYKWADHGIVVRSVPNRDMWNAIDPNLVEDGQGRFWMSFGSFWGGIKLVKMDKDLKSIAHPEEWHTIAKRERSYDTPDNKPGKAAIEAPFIFKKDDYYYLFTSWDYCCQGADSNYKVKVGRSKKVIGPYKDREGKALNEGGGTLVVKGNEKWPGVGHNSTYTFNDKDYIFFHAYDTEERGVPKLKVAELGWDNGWPQLKNRGKVLK